MNKVLCFITGGHKYRPWETEIRHEIDGLYSITSKCCKCGHTRTDLVPIRVPQWENRIKEVKTYVGK